MEISVENHKIFPPRVFCTPIYGDLLGIGYQYTEWRN